MLLDDLITSTNIPYNNNAIGDLNFYAYIPYSLYNKSEFAPYRSYIDWDPSHAYFFKDDNLYIFKNFRSTSSRINNGGNNCKYAKGLFLSINLKTYNYFGGEWRTKCYEYNDVINANTTADYLYPMFKNYRQQDFIKYMKVGNSYIDDLVYSNQTNTILISMLYCFIPLFLFIIGIKVFRKGLFK